uniref:Uncharacterized protein n=1 Tax=Anguilla anguilla TaxID=7936 RepID=A0A0E9T3R6_ANGAN
MNSSIQFLISNGHSYEITYASVSYNQRCCAEHSEWDFV